MNNAQAYGFREDLKIFEGHMHLEFQLPVYETVEIFRKVREYYGYQRMQLLSIPNTEKDPIDVASNLKTIYCKRRLAPNVYAAAGLVHYFDKRDTADSFLQQAQLAYEQGFDSYKMLEGKPFLRKRIGKRLDDPIYDKFYAFAEEKHMPVVMHVADPPEYWDRSRVSEYALKVGWFCDETYPTKDQLHEEAEGIVKKFPELHLVLAHFHFLSGDIDRASSLLDRFPNVSFDMTPGAQEFVDFSKRPDEWKAFFSQYRKRLIYGTDTYNFRTEKGTMYCPHTLRINQLRTFLETDRPFAVGEENACGFALPDDILKDIYYNNLYALLGEPRKINAEAVLRECDSLLQTETDELTLVNLNTIKAVFEWQR